MSANPIDLAGVKVASGMRIRRLLEMGAMGFVVPLPHCHHSKTIQSTD